nr:MAG TPA: hypothetical protein [Caudoviricetes sp.]
MSRPFAQVGVSVNCEITGPQFESWFYPAVSGVEHQDNRFALLRRRRDEEFFRKVVTAFGAKADSAEHARGFFPVGCKGQRPAFARNGLYVRLLFGRDKYRNLSTVSAGLWGVAPSGDCQIRKVAFVGCPRGVHGCKASNSSGNGGYAAE